MTATSPITITAFVSDGERETIQLATGYMARALTQAAEVPWTCDCTFSSDIEALQPSGEGKIIVTSLLPELGKMGEPWPETEKRLRKTYTSLSESGVPVFICTILRHVGHDVEPETAAALLIRIRRLNLLAAEISRETGAYVIDLDRALADIGARSLQTDYRMTGRVAANMAGHYVALTLITSAFDAFVPFEVQDAAGGIVSSSRPAIAETNGSNPEVTLRKDLMSIGRGRRKQIISPVSHTVDENHTGWMVHQVLRGTIEPAEAIQRLFNAVRRRGVRKSVGLLVSGLSRQINRKK